MSIALLTCLFYMTGPGPASRPFNLGPATSSPLGSNPDPGSDAFNETKFDKSAGKSSDLSIQTSRHPIDNLMATAEQIFEETLSHTSNSLPEAAASYRRRRGRHPPPGFQEWYEFAKERDAIVVEEFWDQIYHDLEPFWALPAATIRKEAWDFEMTISVRNHSATAGSGWFWTQIWLSMIQTIAHILPDMDIALNAMDEPRIVVPWEQMSDYMTTAHQTKKMAAPELVVRQYVDRPQPGHDSENAPETRPKEWAGTKPYWLVARRGCPPQSTARTAGVLQDFDHAPIFDYGPAEAHMARGFVANFTHSTEICHQADLQGLNGIFVEPLSVSATEVLFPLFGGSKLSVNNEILLPAPMYWHGEDRFTGGGQTGVEWSLKADKAIWRGVATGGRNRENNWKAFQRHRFVAMNNGTKLARAMVHTEPPANFALPEGSRRPQAQKDGRLGLWVDSWSDVSLVDLMCFPEMDNSECNYTGPYFATTEGKTMAEQFDSKYLPDIDGNSFSGRYLGFLRSTSLPIKATVWREWHDSRLVAWKHFVPMDNRYNDWYGIMEYFLGYGSETKRHDAEAEKIARAGSEWASKVLRKEDMQIYVLRLLLEYARVSDEQREKMGWVEDLLSTN